MAQLEKLSWEECREELRWIVEGRTDLSYERRERLFAQVLMMLMDRVARPAGKVKC